jgi:hypothetical protein
MQIVSYHNMAVPSKQCCYDTSILTLKPVYGTHLIPIVYYTKCSHALERQLVRIVLRVEKLHFDHELCILFSKSGVSVNANT